MDYPSRSRKLYCVVGLLLAGATLAAFWGVSAADFVNLDDNVYVTQNPMVRGGLTLSRLAWAFTSFHCANWHPLTWLSHMLDASLWGLNPTGHHLTNLLLHIINSLLLFAVLAKLTRRMWRSAFVAALFALHPLHVESVAWVAERKDVLSMLFCLATILAYAAYVRRPGWKRYLPVALLFALGLLAKPMLVSLPILLLLLDYWPLGRVRLKNEPPETPKKGKQPLAPVTPTHSPRTLLIEKLPLFALSFASCVITCIAQRAGGAVNQLQELSPLVRFDNAAVSAVQYMLKMFWPTSLAVLYPHPRNLLPEWQVGAALVVLSVATYLAIKAARRCPYITVGWLWYLITLLPVIGLVQVGVQAMADRYTYLPLIGLFIVVAWAVPDLVAKGTSARRLLSFAAMVVLVALGLSTRAQVGCWQDSLTLFNHTLACTQRNDAIHNCLGAALDEMGCKAHAESHFAEALSINPSNPEAQLNVGMACARAGRIDEAMSHFQRAHELNPADPRAHCCMGKALGCLGKFEEAADCFCEAVKLAPNDADAHTGMAESLAALGRLQEAVPHYEAALKLDPDYQPAKDGLEHCLASSAR